MHIGLNAHLLAAGSGYRAAGIHRYIDHLLRELPSALPDGWRLTALVGAAYRQDYPGIHMRRAAINTEPPLRRILWEQLVQPWQLPAFDLYHALAFVAPLVLPVPAVVTVYDLSFIHYPERLSRPRRLYLDRFSRLTCERARRIIAISGFHPSRAAHSTATSNSPRSITLTTTPLISRIENRKSKIENPYNPVG